jgi:hypothetical protein
MMDLELLENIWKRNQRSVGNLGSEYFIEWDMNLFQSSQYMFDLQFREVILEGIKKFSW